MSLNEINDLLRDSQVILKMIEDVEDLVDDAQEKLNKDGLDDCEMFQLREVIIRMLTLTNSYLRKFNAFMDKQNKPNKQKSI